MRQNEADVREAAVRTAPPRSTDFLQGIRWIDIREMRGRSPLLSGPHRRSRPENLHARPSPLDQTPGFPTIVGHRPPWHRPMGGGLRDLAGCEVASVVPRGRRGREACKGRHASDPVDRMVAPNARRPLGGTRRHLSQRLGSTSISRHRNNRSSDVTSVMYNTLVIFNFCKPPVAKRCATS